MTCLISAVLLVYCTGYLQMTPLVSDSTTNELSIFVPVTTRVIVTPMKSLEGSSSVEHV